MPIYIKYSDDLLHMVIQYVSISLHIALHCIASPGAALRGYDMCNVAL
jgi:hypothetical protein